MKIKNFISFDVIQNVHPASGYLIYSSSSFMPEIIYSKIGKILDEINFKQD